jgi:signal peptidase I
VKEKFIDNPYVKRYDGLISAIEIVLVVAIALLCATLFQRDVSSLRGIQGPSMQPLFNGYEDYTSAQWRETRDSVYITRLSPIRRGDIVVFTEKSADGKYMKDEDGNYLSIIKRVIGLGGDTVMFSRDGDGHIRVKVNGEFINEDYLGTVDGRDYRRDGMKEGSVTLDEEYSVPDKTYYLLGDNRGNSKDSRALGAIAATDIEGKAYMKIVPGENFWDGLWKLVFYGDNGMA